MVLLATGVLRFSSPVAVAGATLAAAAARLQDAVDPDAVRAELAAVINDALQPSRVSIWLRP